MIYDNRLFVSCVSDCFKWLNFSRSLKLLYLGREYPQGSAYFRDRLKSAFMKNKDVTDPAKIKNLVARGEFVIKEIEALYFLRKYRAMKKRYYEPDKWSTHTLSTCDYCSNTTLFKSHTNHWIAKCFLKLIGLLWNNLWVKVNRLYHICTFSLVNA